MINKMKALLLIQEKGYVATTDDLWNKIAQELNDAQEMRSELEAKIKMLTNQLIYLSHDRNTCGNDFYLQKIERKGSIDYSAIPELHGVDLEQYRKSNSSYWKLETY